jgi:triosephosphate isomerase
MKRHKIIIGNWKMNLTVPESTLLLERLIKTVKVEKTEVVVCPSFLTIYSAQEITRTSDIKIGSQDAYFEDTGAFTGEVSAHQLKGFVTHSILGHSERRKHFNEGDRTVTKKASACIRHNIVPVVCVGETLHEKEDGLTKLVVAGQVEASLADLTGDEIAKSIVAYEPVWAIGTGHVCDAKKANEVAKNIRNLIKVLYGVKVADAVHILYGGSIDENTAESFIKESDIDGLLIGGSSLDFQKFTEIVNIAEEGKEEESAKPKAKKVTSANKKVKKKK